MPRDTNFPELYESHEAGHVVLASVLGIPYSYVTVEKPAHPDGTTALCHVSIESPLLFPNSREVRTPIPERLHPEVWALATLSLAGITASIANTPSDRCPFHPLFFHSLAQNDFKLIDDLFEAEGLDHANKDRLASETVALVYKQWPEIRAVIEALLLQETLHRPEVEVILAATNRTRSSLVPPQTRDVTLEFVRRVLLQSDSLYRTEPKSGSSM